MQGLRPIYSCKKYTDKRKLVSEIYWSIITEMNEKLQHIKKWQFSKDSIRYNISLIQLLFPTLSPILFHRCLAVLPVLWKATYDFREVQVVNRNLRIHQVLIPRLALLSTAKQTKFLHGTAMTTGTLVLGGFSGAWDNIRGLNPSDEVGPLFVAAEIEVLVVGRHCWCRSSIEETVMKCCVRWLMVYIDQRVFIVWVRSRRATNHHGLSDGFLEITGSSWG